MRLLHTMLRVGNLEKSIAFYTDVKHGVEETHIFPLGFSGGARTRESDGRFDRVLFSARCIQGTYAPPLARTLLSDSSAANALAHGTPHNRSRQAALSSSAMKSESRDVYYSCPSDCLRWK